MPFDRSSYDSVVARADADGLFANAQGDWQPDAEKVVCVLHEILLDTRKDKKTQQVYAICKPVCEIIQGVDAKGNDLTGKTFPLDRYGFSTVHDFSMRNFGRNVAPLAGEPVEAFAAAVAAFEAAYQARTVFEVTRSVRPNEKDPTKPYVNYFITGVINVDTAPPAAVEGTA